MNIKDKVVIVTGASSGIGLATARLLGKKGAKITLVSRSKDKLKNLSRELPDSFVVKTDMSKEKEVKEMVKKVKDHFGRIDILVNNAGQGYDASVQEINTTIFRDLIELDLIGPLVATQQVIPIMKKQGEGTIVNISSGAALMYLPNMSAYSSLKRALVGISLTAREELKEDNICVSVVYPYITLTNFEKNTIKVHKEEMKEGETGGPHPADSAELVAEKIIEGIQNKTPEIFIHDWMKNLH